MDHSINSELINGHKIGPRGNVDWRHPFWEPTLI